MTTPSSNRYRITENIVSGALLIAMLVAIIVYVWLAYRLTILIVLITGIRGQMEYAVLAVVGGVAFLLWWLVGLKLWRRGIKLLDKIGDYYDAKRAANQGDDTA